MKGKFGPYIKYKSTNATIPDNIDPEEILIEEAIDLNWKKTKKKQVRKRKNTSKNKKTCILIIFTKIKLLTNWKVNYGTRSKWCDGKEIISGF